jgi:hypothetical protein
VWAATQTVTLSAWHDLRLLPDHRQARARLRA